MNNKITFPELVDTIAKLTNTSKRVSELFLKELFAIIKERLEQGENVKIKNLGTFKVVEIASRKSVNVNTGEDMEIPAHRRVSFAPDKSLSEAINMPFEGFETVMLDDDITEEDLRELSQIDESVETDVDVEDAEPVDVQESELATETEILEEPQPPVFVAKKEVSEEIKVETELKTETEPEEPSTMVEPEESVVTPAETETEPEGTTLQQLPAVVESSYYDDDEYYEEVKREKRKSFVWGLLAGFVAVVLIGYVAVRYGYLELNMNNDSETVETVAPVEANDTIVAEQVDTVPSIVAPKPITEVVVTDTVRANYFLTKMSRKHYGRYEFWVYIYEENKNKIVNPNSVSPGLVVVIPPAEKYGIDKNNPESVRIAKEKAERF